MIGLRYGMIWFISEIADVLPSENTQHEPKKKDQSGYKTPTKLPKLRNSPTKQTSLHISHQKKKVIPPKKPSDTPKKTHQPLACCSAAARSPCACAVTSPCSSAARGSSGATGGGVAAVAAAAKAWATAACCAWAACCACTWAWKMGMAWKIWWMMTRRNYKLLCHWPSQEPKLEVPTIYKAYVRPM